MVASLGSDTTDLYFGVDTAPYLGA